MKKYIGLVDDIPPGGYDRYVWFSERLVKGIEWCKNNNKEYEVLSENWKSNEELLKAEHYLESVKKKILEYVSPLLNVYHGTNYDAKEWEIAFGIWLDHFLCSYYDKYLRIKKIACARDCDICIFNSTRIDVSLDTYDYARLLFQSDDHHKYQYSLLLSEMKLDDVWNKVYRDEYKRPQAEKLYNNLPEHVKRFDDNYWKYKAKSKNHDRVTIQSSNIKFELYRKIIESNYGYISGYFLNYFTQIRNELPRRLDCSWRMRKTEEKLNCPDEFLALMCRILKKELPIVFVEDFDIIKSIARKNYQYAYQTKVIVYDAGEVFYNEMFKSFLMDMIYKHNTKIDIQHGSSYGLIGPWMQFNTELSVCDVFFTSGWDGKWYDKKNFEVMPFVKFFRMRDVVNEDGAYILYVSYSAPKNIFRTYKYDIDILKYKKEELKFFELLSDELKEHIVARFPSNEILWIKEIDFKNVTSKIKFDSEKNYYESLRKAKLVVGELFGTTIMEAIFLDKPFVVFHNPLTMSTSDSCAIYDEMVLMEKWGLIANSVEDLVSIVNEAAKNIEYWWNNPERKSVVKRLRSKYTYFPDNSEEIWISRIDKYCD